jgi:hypothetical protein
MDVSQVHVFLNCARVELTLVWEFTNPPILDYLVNEFRMLAEQFAKFFEIGIIHFFHSFLGQNNTTL